MSEVIKTCNLISNCIQIFSEMEKKDFKQIKKWAKYAKVDESYFTTYSLTQQIYNTLWNKPEAIEEGFHKYLERRKKEYSMMLSYHDLNCDKQCIVCDDRQRIIKELLGINYERKEPLLYQQ